MTHQNCVEVKESRGEANEISLWRVFGTECHLLVVEETTVLQIVEQRELRQCWRSLHTTQGAKSRSVHARLQAAHPNELQKLLKVILILLSRSGAINTVTLLLHARHETFPRTLENGSEDTGGTGVPCCCLFSPDE